MRRAAAVPVFLLALASAGFAAAPQWARAVGLDFWKLRDDESDLATALDQGKQLDLVAQDWKRRSAYSEQVADAWCNGQISLSEAVDQVAEGTHASPEWFAQVKVICLNAEVVQADASDHDFHVAYLIIKVMMLRRIADLNGDAARVAFLETCKARLGAELPKAPPRQELAATR